MQYCLLTYVNIYPLILGFNIYNFPIQMKNNQQTDCHETNICAIFAFTVLCLNFYGRTGYREPSTQK